MNKIKFTILFFTLLNYSFVFNQMQTKGYFGLNQIFHPTKDFTESNLDLGMSFQFDKFSISPFILYQFGGNYKINNYKPYTLNYNLIGAGLGVKMRGTDKKEEACFKLNCFSKVPPTMEVLVRL
ncbi:MAG: hypothetical protein M9916_03900 [Crocinitomicaceae bacterium]|nr:hypothetical protein [Crocinitomicaceae bacterium]